MSIRRPSTGFVGSALLSGLVALAAPAPGGAQCHHGEVSTSVADSFEMYYRGQLGCTDAVWWGVMGGVRGDGTDRLWKWDYHRDDVERDLRPAIDDRFISTQVIQGPRHLTGFNLAANSTGGIGGWEYSVSPVYPDGRSLGRQTERFPTLEGCRSHRAGLVRAALTNMETMRREQALSAADERSLRSFADAGPCLPRGSEEAGAPEIPDSPTVSAEAPTPTELGNISDKDLRVLVKAAQLIALAGDSPEAAAALARLSQMSSEEIVGLGLSQGVAALLGESPDLTSALSAMSQMSTQDIQGLNLGGLLPGGLGDAGDVADELSRWTQASSGQLEGMALSTGIASVLGAKGQDLLGLGQVGGLLGSILTKSPEEQAAEAERQRQLEAQRREFTQRVAAQFQATSPKNLPGQGRRWRGGDPDTARAEVRVPPARTRWRRAEPAPTAEARALDLPYSTPPDISDWAELDRVVEREYPSGLRYSGVGGSVNVWVYIAEDGGVLDARLDESSGHEELDLAALRTLRALSFEPAYSGGEPVGAWISLPVTFRPTR